MGLSKLSAKCRACPFVDTCDHKEMEAHGFIPFRNAENLQGNSQFPIGTIRNLGDAVKISGGIDAEGLVRTISRETVKKSLENQRIEAMKMRNLK